MTEFLPELLQYIEKFISELNLPEKRIHLLNPLKEYIVQKLTNQEEVNLIFICTHNSRRSHLAHLWAVVAAKWYQIEKVNCFSGGTEETAFNPRAVAALIRAGFRIENMDHVADNNPRYKIIFSETEGELIMFSKTFDHRLNPKENFAAVMVCSHADENCPFIPGAEQRFSLPYEDPKDFDETESESLKYDERCLEIAREMFYLFHQIDISLKPKK